MVDKKDKKDKKKKKIKKTATQKQKQKQSVSVVVNVNKPAGRRRTLAKKTSDNRPLPSTPQSYGIPVQQSTQPTLNNITEYLKRKEGEDNNRHVNILSAMNAIQRAEGVQMSVVQSEKQTSDKPPPDKSKGKQGRPRMTDEQKEVAAAQRLALKAEEQAAKEASAKKAAKKQAKIEAALKGVGGKGDFVDANPTNPTGDFVDPTNPRGDLGPTRDTPPA